MLNYEWDETDVSEIKEAPKQKGKFEIWKCKRLKGELNNGLELTARKREKLT